jgi:hypothetical protein
MNKLGTQVRITHDAYAVARKESESSGRRLKDVISRAILAQYKRNVLDKEEAIIK